MDGARVVRPDTDIEVSVGETGELAARGPSTIRGYFAAPDRDRDAFLAVHAAGFNLVAGAPGSLVGR